MSVLVNEEKNELIITCDCGCEDALHILIDKDNDKCYSFLSYMNGNFYRDQYTPFERTKRKLQKIWAIVRNKDYCYSDVIMSKEDFKTFADYILNHYTKLIQKELNQNNKI